MPGHQKHATNKGSAMPGIAMGAEGAATAMELAAGHSEGWANAGARGMGAIAGPLAMMTGGIELAHAKHALHEGDTAEAFRTGAAGTTSLVGGSATTATSLLGAEAVGGAVAHTGPLAFAFGSGLATGHAMDEATRSSGRFTQTRGGRGLGAASHEEALSASEYGGLRGQQAEQRYLEAGVPAWLASTLGAKEAISSSLDAAFVGAGASIADTVSSWFD